MDRSSVWPAVSTALPMPTDRALLPRRRLHAGPGRYYLPAVRPERPWPPAPNSRGRSGIAIPHKARTPRLPELPVKVVRFSGASLRYGVGALPSRVSPPASRVRPAQSWTAFRFRRLVGKDVALEALRDACVSARRAPTRSGARPRCAARGRWSARCWRCCPDDFGEELRRFIGPVCDGLIEERPFTEAWPAGGPWRPGDSGWEGRRRPWTETTERIEEARPRRFRRYPEYKDSGVEWLGEIPAHWSAKRLTDIANLINASPLTPSGSTDPTVLPSAHPRPVQHHNRGKVVRGSCAGSGDSQWGHPHEWTATSALHGGPKVPLS